MLEEARSIGELLKTGWKPKRTLVYCAWDGEEPGLLGSTEWVEDHTKELQQKAVAYINSDANGRGFLGASGSHAFETLVYEIAKDVKDPQTGVSVYERRKASEAVGAATAKAKKDILTQKGMTIGAMGSGSDYSSFIQHAGVPSLDFGYGGEDPGGEYHSIYDSYDNYRRFKDSTFEYGVALSKTTGRAALRLANADVLPFDFRSLQKTVAKYVNELSGLIEQMRESTSAENELIKSNSYALANDPLKPKKVPEAKAEVPYIDFSPLQNALTNMEKATAKLNDAWTKKLAAGGDNTAFNQALYRAEQQLLTENGLPRRGWYRHTLYAPGFYTGYGVKTMPGVREAIEQRDWKEATEQIKIDADALNKFSDYLLRVAEK
jgi:N-acetylated-alpha-linked acidic dipeptidase